MDAFRAWAYTVCCASLLVGILENTLPRRSGKAVIKLAAGLYIITVLAAPLASVARGWAIPAIHEKAEQMTVEYDRARQAATQAVERAFAENAKAALSCCLADQGVAEAEIEVETSRGEEGTLYIAKVYVRTAEASTQETAAAAQAMENALGHAVPIYLNGEKL